MLAYFLNIDKTHISNHLFNLQSALLLGKIQYHGDTYADNVTAHLCNFTAAKAGKLTVGLKMVVKDLWSVTKRSLRL